MKLWAVLSVSVLLVASWIFAAESASAAAASGYDWPQWRGINRDGISPEKGILKTWPSDGPKALWRIPIGEAYSGIAVANGRVFTMDAKGNDEFVVCVDATTGKEVWRARIDSKFQNDQGGGPRSTPTVEGNWVYALGAQGRLVALDAKDGKTIWSHNLRSEFGSDIPRWGTSTAPLIEKDLLLVDVGGKSGYALMAFNKKDGSVVWKTHTDKQGYSSPIAVTVPGGRQILFFTGTALVSVTPQGKLLWKFPWRTDYDANIATPILVPPDLVYISTSYGTGAALVRIKQGKAGPTIEEVWRSKVSQNHFNTSILHQGHIYGFDNAILQCIEAKTGTEKWKHSGLGKGSLIYADGHLIILSERGELVLAEATPEAFKEKSRAQVLQGRTWTSPTLANGKLYLRSAKEMVCLDLKNQ